MVRSLGKDICDLKFLPTNIHGILAVLSLKFGKIQAIFEALSQGLNNSSYNISLNMLPSVPLFRIILEYMVKKGHL